jgi:citrate synthase
MAAADLLTAEEAAEHLGVSRATLYAYVSRGLVASEPGPGPSRARRYPRGALDEFRGRRERNRDREMAALGSLHWGLPLLDSALTLIRDGRLYYRGRDAVELSRSAAFEQVAGLLWTGDEHDAAGLFPGDGAAGADPGPAEVPIATRLCEHLVAAADRTLVTLGSRPAATLRAAGRAVEGLFAAAGARAGGTLAERLARGWRTDAHDDLRAALVLCADHDLNASSFTARCVASADARLEHVLLAALCALRGRRHGGLLERVEDLLDHVGRDGARAAADRAMGDGPELPGFGHPLYPDGDPRGAELLARAGPAGGVDDLVTLAREELGLQPTLDLGLAALARARGLPPGGAFALFALGRSAGWVAHAREAWADERLIRPRSRYIGPEPRDSA